jgi:MFS family permease
MSGFSSKMVKATFLLRNRPLRRLVVAQFSALTALYGLGLAGVVLAEEQTGSTAQTGLVILASILPAFLGSLISGAVVDRWGRVRVLKASHLVRACIAFVFWLGVRGLPIAWGLVLVYLVNATMALVSQFSVPAELSLLPDLGGQGHLLSANTLYQFSMLIAEGVGIIFLGPLVVKLVGAPAMGLAGALLCSLALALVAALPKVLESTGPAGKGWSGWAALSADLQAGWRVIARDRLLRLVVLQSTLAAVLLLVLLSLVPGLAARFLELDVADAPLLILPGGVGFGLGAYLVNRWEQRLSRQAWIACGLFVVGLNIGLLTASIGADRTSCLLVNQALILGVGLALAPIIITARTVLEERPPAGMRGRVIAAQLALGNAAAVLPLLLGGALADVLGIQSVMGLLSLAALSAGAVGWHYARS